jgi:hypothetical protein
MVRGRHNIIESSRQYGDGVSASVQRRLVGYAIHAYRQAADDDNSLLRQLTSEFFCDVFTVRGNATASDDGYTWPI